MTRRLLLMVLLLAALVAADRALTSAESARRASSLRIAPLLPDAGGVAGKLAAVRVETGGEAWLFGQKQGQWRCLNWRGALADGDAVLALISSLLDAVGVPLSEQPSDPGAYGLDVPSMVTVSLHGPKATLLDRGRDRFVAVDIGADQPGGGGCFVRLHGERAVWAIDTAPGAALRRTSGDRVPPLVERKLVPASWPGLPMRVQSLRVELAGQRPYELTLRAVEISKDEYVAGRPPFEWVLVSGGESRDCAELLVLYFIDHVLDAAWTGLADTAMADHIGLENPRARLTLMSGEAPPLELTLGTRLPGGVTAVWNGLTQQLCELPGPEESLLFPSEATFAPDTVMNPWDIQASQEHTDSEHDHEDH